MAITPTKRKGSPYWYARGTYKGVEVFETTKILHADAKRPPRIVDEFIDEVIKKEIDASLEKNNTNKTFEELAALYLKRGGSPKFLEKILDEIGHKRMSALPNPVLQEHADNIYGHCLPDTINRQFVTPVNAVANSAGLGSIMSKRKVKKSRVANTTKAFRYEDVIMFLNNLHISTAEIMFFLFYTGMRPIEAILLDCDDVNLDDRWMVLNKTKTDDPRGVPIHECLVPLLSRKLELGGRLFKNSLGRPWPDNRKFNSEGRIIEQSGGQFDQPLKTAYEKTGIRIKPYGARHTVATYLIYPGGVNETVKNDILGHGNRSDISLDYIHLPKQSHKEGIAVLPDPIALGLRKDLL